MAAGRMTTNPENDSVSNTDSFPSVSGGLMSPVGHGASRLLGAPGNSLFPHLVQLLGPGGPHRSNISLGGRISSLPLTLLLLAST